jgi:hypothetical protein
MRMETGTKVVPILIGQYKNTECCVISQTWLVTANWNFAFLRPFSWPVNLWTFCCILHIMEISILTSHQHWPLDWQWNNCCEIEHECSVDLSPCRWSEPLFLRHLCCSLHVVDVTSLTSHNSGLFLFYLQLCFYFIMVHAADFLLFYYGPCCYLVCMWVSVSY